MTLQLLYTSFIIFHYVYSSPHDFKSSRIENFEELIRPKRQETAEICDFGTDTDLLACDWSNRNGTILRWETGAGSLSNWLGGPARDASTSEDAERGGYIYFETSFLPMPHDSRVAQTAYMESSVLGSTGPEGKCIGFSYAMDGLSAAGLRILLKPLKNLEDDMEEMDRVLWSNKDLTNGRWNEADVLYTYNKDHQIVFEGISKDVSDPHRRYRGYVAVDNVALKPGLDCRGHCTFEGGFCGWTNDEDDDFDWSLSSSDKIQGRGSRNPSTGPAMDRSSFVHGGLEGGYAYINSAHPRRPGDVARLSSLELDATGPDTPMCLRFWTHMYGNGIGTLSIILMDVREGNEKDLWRLSGEAGNSWYQAEVPVSSPNPFKIVLSGQVGKNSLGDIAVDDLSFTPGSCPTAPQIASPTPGDCTFEVDECSWFNVPLRDRTDDIDWERVSGQASRSLAFDHTLSSDKGFYMALARNNNVQRPGSRAWFSSREFNGSSTPRCISFWYILNEPFIGNTGPSLGALAIYSRVQEGDGGSSLNPIWKLYNHQGPEWRYAQAVIQEDKPYSIIIEGLWGSSLANGLIGFDDITLFDGSCTTMPSGAIVRTGECRFERDACDWMNSTSEKAIASWKLATVARRPANLPDKTFGAPEGYIYFDLFNSGSNVVKLTSRTIAVSDFPLCLTFWYAAFGAGESAELRIIRQDNSSSEEENRQLWVLDAKAIDTSRPIWSPAQVSVDTQTDFRIVLEGKATNGGFAVDDVIFSTGSCATRPEKASPKEEEDGNN